MRKWIAMFMLGAAITATGCKSNDPATTQPGMTADACSHCAGVQTISAAGKCPMCGMDVSKK